VPSAEKKIGVPPPLEDGRSSAGSVPDSGVWKYQADPTATAPSALGWPKIVLLSVCRSLKAMVSLLPGLMTFMRPGSGPPAGRYLAIAMMKAVPGPGLM
jgi:hypothetical protein